MVEVMLPPSAGRSTGRRPGSRRRSGRHGEADEQRPADRRQHAGQVDRHRRGDERPRRTVRCRDRGRRARRSPGRAPRRPPRPRRWSGRARRRRPPRRPGFRPSARSTAISRVRRARAWAKAAPTTTAANAVATSSAPRNPSRIVPTSGASRSAALEAAAESRTTWPWYGARTASMAGRSPAAARTSTTASVPNHVGHRRPHGLQRDDHAIRVQAAAGRLSTACTTAATVLPPRSQRDVAPRRQAVRVALAAGTSSGRTRREAPAGCAASAVRDRPSAARRRTSHRLPGHSSRRPSRRRSPGASRGSCPRGSMVPPT